MTRRNFNYVKTIELDQINRRTTKNADNYSEYSSPPREKYYRRNIGVIAYCSA